MAKCDRCNAWYPSSPGPTKAILTPLFHTVDCVYHYGMGDTYDFELEALLGTLFGTADLVRYVFKGNLLYEIDLEENERVVATYTDFPKSPEQKLKEAESKKPEPNSDWEKWKAERKLAESRANAALDKREDGYGKKPQSNFSFHARPWESVDRAKQPHLWWFYFKCAFLPGIHKDLKYGASVPYYQRGHNQYPGTGYYGGWDGD